MPLTDLLQVPELLVLICQRLLYIKEEIKVEWSRYLADERIMMFHPYVAKVLGLNEAIFLQQLHYWLNRKPHYIDSKGWVYNPYKSWQEQLCFLSESTIKRTIKNLVDKGIVITANFNKLKFQIKRTERKVQMVEQVQMVEKVQQDLVSNKRSLYERKYC